MVRNWKKRTIQLGLIFTVCFSISAQKQDPSPMSVPAINQWLDSLGRVYVPDRREGIFSVTAKKDKNSILLYGESDQKECIEKIRKKFSSLNIAITDSIRWLPDKSVYPACWGLVNVSVANLRAKPGHEKELVSQAILGTPIFILKIQGKWLLAQTPDKYIGWITGSSVVRMDSAQFDKWKESTRAMYLSNDGWLFSSPASKEVICDLVAGSILNMGDEREGFLPLILPDGRMGYSPKELWKDMSEWQTNPNWNEENLIRHALSLTGVPYLWGGTSSKGMDCSGFTKTVYFLNGIILARDASLQYRHGEKIDITDDYRHLQKGDLLFFGIRENGKDKVTHVGIYLESGKLIHANTSASCVSINSLIPGNHLYSDYLRNSLLGVRRIIGQSSTAGIIPIEKHYWYTFPKNYD